jgi:hypothetical protein
LSVPIVSLPWVNVFRSGRLQARAVDAPGLADAPVDAAGDALEASLGATLGALVGAADGVGVAAVEQPATTMATPRTATRTSDLITSSSGLDAESVIARRNPEAAPGGG